MDGFKRRVRESIQLRLSLWLSLVILGAAVVAGAASFSGAFDDANELQDGTLLQVATLIRQQPAVAQRLDQSASEIDPESRLIVQSISINSGTSQADAGALPLSPELKDGLQTVKVRDTSYRVLAKTLPGGGRIAVSQETAVRDEIALGSAVRTVLPLLIMVPVLLLLVAILVRRMFRPITRMASEIDSRTEGELHPLQQAHLPTEIRPFVSAINSLLSRVAQSMESQQRFVADAAHELRSPMAALALQAEMLGNVTMPAEATKRLTTLRQGIDRGRKLLDQLLSLARAQATRSNALTTISAQQVYRRVLEDLMPLAEAKHIDLGVKDSTDALVIADEVDLIAVVKNLVDNAIRYTPNGGRIDLSVSETAQQVILEVEDNGMGIAAEERERVLDPFYRVLGSDQSGSGLGLSIVKVIVQRLRGRIELSDSVHFQNGLLVRIIIEKRAPAGY